MEKPTLIITSGISTGGFGYWLLGVLNFFTPEEWAAIGVIGNLFFGGMMFAFWLYFKLRQRRKSAGE